MSEEKQHLFSGSNRVSYSALDEPDGQESSVTFTIESVEANGVTSAPTPNIRNDENIQKHKQFYRFGTKLCSYFFYCYYV